MMRILHCKMMAPRQRRVISGVLRLVGGSAVNVILILILLLVLPKETIIPIDV